MESLNNIEEEEIEVGRRTYCVMVHVKFVDEETGELVSGPHFYSSGISGETIIMEDRDKAKSLSSGELSLEQIDAFTSKQKNLDFLKKAIEGKYRIPEGCIFFGIEPYVLLIQKNEHIPLIINSNELHKFAAKLRNTQLESRRGIFPEQRIYLARETNKVKLESYGNFINRIIDLICKYRFDIAESDEDKIFFDSVVSYDSHLAEKLKNHDNFGVAMGDMEALKRNIFTYYPGLREIFIKVNALEEKANCWRLKRTYNGQEAYYDVRTQNYVLINGKTTKTIEKLEYYSLEYLDSLTLMWETAAAFDQMIDMVCHSEICSDEEIEPDIEKKDDNDKKEESKIEFIKPIESDGVCQYLPDYSDGRQTRHPAPKFELVSIDNRRLPALFGSDQRVIKTDFIDFEPKIAVPKIIEEAQQQIQPIGSIKVTRIDSTLPDFVQEVMEKEQEAEQTIRDGLSIFRDTPLVVRAIEEQEKPKEKYENLEIKTEGSEDLGCLQRILRQTDGFGVCDLYGQSGNEMYLTILSILKYVSETCSEDQLNVFRTVSSESPTSFDYRDIFLISNASQYIKLRSMFTIAREEQKIASPIIYTRISDDRTQAKQSINRMLKEYNPLSRSRVRAEEL